MADRKLFTDWREFIAQLRMMTEPELKNAINYEVSTNNRSSVVIRLHQRYTKLRATRERNELIEGSVLL
jgi:hypothetical protein